MAKLTGLEPFVAAETKYLILGSFPSVKSLELGFYYSHPRNRFFWALAQVFEEETPVEISERRRFLNRHGISLFDIIASCERQGSLDSAIRDVTVNDLTPFFDGKIKIGCTGRTSYNHFKKYYPERSATYLPSSSPANQLAFSLDPYRRFFAD